MSAVFLRFGWLLGGMACLALSGHAALKSPVATESGLLSGVPGDDRSITVFKGVPFATAPVGDRRWRAPEPPRRWSGLRMADRFGANCIQTIVEEKKPWTHEFMAHGEVSEDCLFLNIWTQAARPREKRPVFVYLHGGANTEGSGSVDAYNGEGLARKGLVMITINYRLGVLGFLTHPELSKESASHVSGNYALLDQMAALQWIRKNIAAFGGDPDRVTVAGQSAGASDIALLILSPLAKGLFERALMESGGAPSGGTGRDLASAEADGLKFADLKGAHSLAELRAMSWMDLVSPVPNARVPRFGPVMDSFVMPTSGVRVNDVPTLTGSNADENGASPGGGEADNATARNRQRAALAKWAAERGAHSTTPAFLYFYNHVLPGPEAGKYGAFHTSEVPYVLNSLDHSERPFTAEDRGVAETLSSYWANFAAKGDPNGKGLPHWPSTKEEPGMVMELGAICRPIPAADSLR